MALYQNFNIFCNFRVEILKDKISLNMIEIKEFEAFNAGFFVWGGPPKGLEGRRKFFYLKRP